VEKVTKEVQTLIDDMLETMRAAPGQGLAAPQIGVLQRVVVVEAVLDEKEPDKKVVYTLVNPEIVKSSEETWQNAEGCLSIPGWQGEVERPLSVTVKAQDRAGNRVKLDLTGWPARAMQHEIDHLDGILYIDKLVAPDRVWRIKEGEEEEQVA
jgi:peptide deformylase